MQLSKLKKLATDVMPKGENHLGEQCYYAFFGDQVIDVIENKTTGIMEVCLFIVDLMNQTGRTIRQALEPKNDWILKKELL